MEKLPEPPSREVTPPERYLSRRELLRAAGFLGISGGLGGGLLLLSRRGRLDAAPVPSTSAVDPRLVVSSEVRAPLRTDDAPTPWEQVTTYNNFYELGFRKGDPARRAGSLKPRPWTVRVEGEVHRPGTFDVDELVRRLSVEERVYRMRCVEAWSMVIPWLGFPLRKLLALVEPTSRAKYVELTTLLDPEQLPGQKDDSLPWPYVEGLRIDEAMHPLTLLATGLYGKELPGQNGAPLRLVVPWKYGFKGVKSIVRIALVEQQPKTTWSSVAPTEYGFYANVNPAVAHPRWSQAEERRIGDDDKRATLPFNGYADQVASLYAGMDLRRSF